MPTKSELEALVVNCTVAWTSVNGIEGRMVTGKDAYAGRSIFLPVGGTGENNSKYFTAMGLFWSSTSNTEGPGPVLSFDNITHGWTQTGLTEINAATVTASGDYREVELALLARPWFEVADWLRVVGTFGVGASYARFDLDTSIRMDGGDRVSYSETFDAWDFYGIAGLGLMGRFETFCLGVDSFVKVGDDALDVNGSRGDKRVFP